ncbi:MAG TPA: chaperone modulator CbpM [Casimicrobiaceae bacterium]|nr:chaperone modulator CbpM [Casimicrobiaceae bacterium]
MRVELTELYWLDEQHDVTLAELADLSGFSEGELHELEASGAIAPVDAATVPLRFSARCVVAARTAFRLRNDFELDSQGLAVALALLERIGSLEETLRELRAQLPSRSGGARRKRDS